MRKSTACKLVAGSLVLLTACSTAPPQVTRSALAEQELAEALAGRVAGKPVDCLPGFRVGDMKVIDDNTILFREGSTIYLQKPRGGCPGIDGHHNILVTRLFGTTQLCRGDINHLIDPTTGIGGGACVFSDFVPYTKPSG
jgi:hypothetical protein